VRPSDGELVKLAGAGDVAAFGRLVERHRGPLLDLARRLSGDREWDPGVPPIRLADVLLAISGDVLTERELLAAVGGAGIRWQDRSAVIDDLVTTRLVERADDGYRLAFPIIRQSQWNRLWAFCREAAGTLAEQVADTLDLYHKLVAECTFRDCRAADVVAVCVGSASNAQWRAVVESGALGDVPEEADGSYGVRMILPDER
jgi:hypothetical protein